MMPTPQDRYIQIGNIRARYWAAGCADAPPLVLIHGILRFVEEWSGIIPTLAKTHRVYALDLVGHGCTDKPDIDYGVEAYGSFVQQFLDQLGLEQVTFIAHSLGGGIVLELARLMPTRITRLVLVSSAGFGPEVHWACRLGSIPWLPEFHTLPNRLIIQQALRHVVYDPSIITSAMVTLAHQRFHSPGAQRAFLRTLRAGATWRGVRPDLLARTQQILPQLTCPTLIIWGRQDKVLPVYHAKAALASLPNATLTIIEHCGHLPMWEHAAEFNRCVATFLAIPQATQRK